MYTGLHPTTANILAYVLNSSYGSSGCYSNPVALHSTTHWQHNGSVSWNTSPMWPDAHHSNEPSYQWQVFVTPPSSGILGSPPHLAAEYHIPSESQPHGGNIHHPPDNPPTHHQYSPPHPPSPFLPCKWVHDDTFRICGFQGTLKALKAHYKTHLNAGPPHSQMKCHWDRCKYKKRSNSKVRSMRQDCMWRHTREVHLGMKRPRRAHPHVLYPC